MVRNRDCFSIEIRLFRINITIYFFLAFGAKFSPRNKKKREVCSSFKINVNFAKTYRICSLALAMELFFSKLCILVSVSFGGDEIFDPVQSGPRKWGNSRVALWLIFCDNLRASADWPVRIFVNIVGCELNNSFWREKIRVWEVFSNARNMRKSTASDFQILRDEDEDFVPSGGWVDYFYILFRTLCYCFEYEICIIQYKVSLLYNF